MKQLVLIFNFFLVAYTVQAQQIHGFIKQRDGWRNIVYLIEVSSFDKLLSGSDENVVDSFVINTNGKFESGNLKKNTLYRLNIVPEHQGIGTLIQKGTDNNYAFFATTDTGTVRFNADMNAFYQNYDISGPNNTKLDSLQSKILTIRRIKQPVFDQLIYLGSQYEKLDKKDSSAVLAFQSEAVKQLKIKEDLANLSLAHFIRSESNYIVLSLALIFYGFENNLTDSTVIAAKHFLYEHKSHSLAASIIEKIDGYKDVRIEELFKSRFYLLNGNEIRLDSISSEYILLDFWASWCLPCRVSIKGTLKKLKSQVLASKLTIIGVATDENKHQAYAAIRADRNPFLQLYENSGQQYLYNLFQIQSLPTYILISKKTGRIRKVPAAELIIDIINNE